jgi:hypothetical protein
VISIEKILKDEGPMLSSDLATRLVGAGLSNEAARQRISRAIGQMFGDIQRLRGLVFPRGARFLYHESSFGSEAYWRALVRDIHEASPAYSAAIAAMQARGGIVTRRHFDIISGSPVLQRGQISSATVLERLTAVQLLREITIEGVGDCVRLSNAFDFASHEQFKARLIAENMLLLAIKDWARKLNVASYDKIQLRDDNDIPPKVGTCHWDVGGPSYLQPMMRWMPDGKPKPGFLVCDVVLANDYISERAVEAFVRKCRLMTSFKNMGQLFPVLVADGFSPEGFRLGRSNGVMMATPAALFGREVASGLASLLQTLTKAAAVAAARPEAIGELFAKLGSIEGAAGNLRGALFEMMVGHCVVKVDDGSIDIGRKIVDLEGAGSAEIDVFRVKEYREVWCYECKARQPTDVVTESDVQHWLNNRIPLIQRGLDHEPRFRECKRYYEYWTCGTFSTDALDLLKARSSKVGKYSIAWKDGVAVRQYIARVKPKSVARMFDEHFFHHPLSEFERRSRSAPGPSRRATLELVVQT